MKKRFTVKENLTFPSKINFLTVWTYRFSDMLDELRSVIETVDTSIVQFADMRSFESTELKITVRKGKAEDISSDKLGGVAIRVLVDGAWGFASVASFERQKLLETLATAIKMAKGASQHITRKASITVDQAFEGRNEFQPDVNPKDLSFEEKYELAAKTEKVLREHDSRIISSQGRYTEKIQRETIVNTLGTAVVNDYGVFRLNGSATARSGDVIQNVSDSVATNAGVRRLLDWDIENEMTKLGERAISLLDAVPSPSGRMNVVLEPSLVGVYIHEAFGHASEGDAILAGNSVLRNKIGEKLAISGVNVIDDPTLPGMRGSFKYDSEGTPTSRREIIRDGVLVGYLNDLQSASMLDRGNALNGAGRATDFRHMSMPRMGNTYIDRGNLSFEELLESVGNGVYLTHSYGGYVNPANGQFYFSSQSGYLIENGELTKPIRNSGMSGLTLEVLQNTIGVGRDLVIDAFPGVCGKANLTGFQPMPVTGGGPTIAARDIVVGGK